MIQNSLSIVEGEKFMYYCPECGTNFEKPDKKYCKHNLSSPPYEKIYCCPKCNSESFFEKTTTHCRCCGAKLKKGAFEYCSDACKKKGEKLWIREIKRRNLLINNPINKIVHELEIYNKINGTNYSYGQYVTLILPKEKRKDVE